MKKKNLSREDWDRIIECVKMGISERAKVISRNIYDNSLEICLDIAECMIDDIKLLEKIEAKI